MKPTYGSYFTGGGVADVGAIQAGFMPLFGVECDPSNYDQSMRIADAYERNIGEHMLRQPVQEIDPASLPRVDWFHASPVCKNASVAKANAEETDIDMVTAQATADYIMEHLPKVVTVENVWQYRKFASWHTIAKALLDLGYQFRVDHINMADYGVPQTRKRMIVTAVHNENRLGLLAPTHQENPPERIGLFDVALPRWIGWYEAIEDLIPTLPDSEFAPWQLERLPDEMRTLLVKSGDEFSKIPYGNEPCYTLSASMYSMGRAFIMYPANSQSNGRRWKDGDDTAMTLTAGDCGNINAFVVNESSTMEINKAHQPVATQVSAPRNLSQRALIHGRVVKMTPRALARFQSLPDSYELPERATDAGCLIGNGLPTEFQRLQGERLKALFW